MADVNVYDVRSSQGLTDLGRTVLPANVLPFDFSQLDKAIAAENDIANKGLETIMANVKDMGRIQDELTGITSPSLYHAAQLEETKKALDLNKEAFSTAVNNIDNPMALYDLDRKTKRLYTSPVVKNIMHDNAVLEAFKQSLPKITDPHLRLKAIQDMDAATSNATDPNAIKSLNLDMYKAIDLETAYIEALDKFAPYIPTTVQKAGPNGTTYFETVNQRDPDMVAKTRQYFQNEPVIKNNLSAKGYLDAGSKWFDDVEKSQLAPISQISNVKGATGGGKTGSGKYQYQLSPNMQGMNYAPNVYKDTDIGDVDLGIISAVETGGRAPDNTVHIDPSQNGLNFGAYSFNGGIKGVAKNYFEFLSPHAALNPEAQKALDELKAMQLYGGDLKAKEAQAQAAYSKLEKAIGTDKLASLENQYAVNEFGKPIISYMKSKEGFEDVKLTPGDSTLLMDTAIQWVPQTWKKWIDEYAAGDQVEPLSTFITKKRIEQATKNANAGNYSAELAQIINDRAIMVWEAANRIDSGGAPPPTASGQPGSTPAAPNALLGLSQFNQDLEAGVTAAQDSIYAEQNADIMAQYGYGPPQQ